MSPSSPNTNGPAPAANSSRAAFRRILENPVQLRLAVSAILLAAWYFALYNPLATQIDEAAKQLAQERRILGLAEQVEQLRDESERVQGRISEDGDRNVLARHLMQSVHGLDLRLKSLDPRPVSDVGPYKAATYLLVVTGPYDAVQALLRRLESSKQLLRIDMIRLASTNAAENGASDEVEMRLTIMGIIG